VPQGGDFGNEISLLNPENSCPFIFDLISRRSPE
jgi:hypothetical protein